MRADPLDATVARAAGTITDTGVVDAGVVDAAAATVAGKAGARRRDDAAELIGRSLGRYRVQARLGAGGMGVVWAALDPALDRRVAVKVLPSRAGASRDHLEVRLRREAQALARLEHPNVIAVYDVGVAADSVFVAMQLVDGVTLDTYVAREHATPAAIAALFVQACRGLAAAHAAGIVHRDVKPSNLLVDGAGRVFVGDFGLARGAAADDALAIAPADASLLDAELTRAGAVLGTPLYMAPEQHAGQAATERADQFSLCVSMWTVLYGQHPFAPEPWDAAAAVAAMRADRVVEPTRRVAVPTRVVRALRRGLRGDPAARWPSMAALADELTPRTRIGWFAAAGGVAAIGGAVALTLAVAEPAAVTPPCAADASRFADAWSPARADTLRTAFAASRRPYASTTAASVIAALDGYRARWVATRVAVCEATEVHHEQSSELLDRRMRCLDARRTATGALVDVLVAPGDPVVVDRAIDAVAALETPDTCATVAATGVPLPSSPAAQAELARLSAEVERVRALGRTGRPKVGLERVAALRGPVEALAYPPLTALLALTEGQLYDHVGRYDAAIAQLDAATAAAVAAQDPALEARAWVDLFGVAIVRKRDPKSTDLRLRPAELALARAGAGASFEARAELLRYRAIAEAQREQFSTAIALADELIALCEGARNEVLLGSALHAAALVRQWAGQPAEAVPFLTRALANAERRLGPEHPNLAATLTTLASVQSELGDRVASRAAAERAVAVYTASVGADSPMIVGPMVALANDAAELGHFAEAVPRYRRALAILDRDPEANVASRALVSGNLGGALAEWQRFDEALPLLRRSLALHEARLGSEHAELAWPLLALGFALRSVGELTEARSIQERALAIVENAFGAAHVYTAYPISELAQLDVEARAWPSAVRNAERALALQLAAPSAPEEIATTRFILAQALHGSGAHARALAQAREAATALHALGDTSAADVDAWITEHTAKPATTATP